MSVYVADIPQGMEELAGAREIVARLKAQDSEGRYGRLELELDNVNEEDWSNAWKKYYHPVRVGEHLVVCPSWEEYQPQEGDGMLTLNPGMAVGTGTHDTTRLCMELLEKYITPEDSVLDVGCGGGANIAIWLDKCRNGHVTGLDYSEISVAESQKLNALAIKQGKCCVVQGDVAAIPFPDAVFDYVSAFETIYFWPGLKKCFFEVNRVLKNGGTFLICNESDGTNDADEKWTKLIDGMKIYTSDQLIAALKEAGFTEIKTYSNTKNHWISIVATK